MNTVCSKFQPSTDVLGKPSNFPLCCQCNQLEEYHGKPCLWFDPQFQNQAICRKCLQSKDEHRVCDFFLGRHGYSCVYCGHVASKHSCCDSFENGGDYTNWCKKCGQHKTEHLDVMVCVTQLTDTLTDETLFENVRRKSLEQRIEEQWLSAWKHFRVCFKNEMAIHMSNV